MGKLSIGYDLDKGKIILEGLGEPQDITFDALDLYVRYLMAKTTDSLDFLGCQIDEPKNVSGVSFTLVTGKEDQAERINGLLHPKYHRYIDTTLNPHIAMVKEGANNGIYVGLSNKFRSEAVDAIGLNSKTSWDVTSDLLDAVLLYLKLSPVRAWTTRDGIYLYSITSLAVVKDVADKLNFGDATMHYLAGFDDYLS